MKKRIGAALLAGMMCLSVCSTTAPQSETEVSAATAYTMEYLDRGISAVGTGSGMLVSWRYLANDPDDAIYKLYRDGNLVYTSNSGDATCYLDAGGSSSSVYKVETYSGTTLVSSETCKLSSSNAYFDVPMDVPTSSNCTYSPNDCSVGDVDGDGQYELFVKWDPSNSQDNSKSGTTDKVYIDCYRLDGTKLWRIDLGINIRAGAHYTQFLVADFDLDGKAEMTCKTADGTVDGTGVTIGDASADYRNSSGYVLSGPEYYTLFDGETGKALDTVDYNPPRGTVKNWGDSYGNRVDRFLGAVMYLDGNKPSAVTVRGYYTRLTACAYDVVDDKLVQRWYFDTGNSSSAVGYGDGNHNCMPADVDSDGKQELVLGALCLDDDGTVLWCTNKGHGDAMHLGDFLPDNDGLELWVCHEVSPYGGTLIDCENGETIFHYDASSDTGRCGAGNIWTGNDGGEFWVNNTVYSGDGTALSCRRPALNFLSYWDGDLEREILDGYTDSPATITDMGEDGKLTTILSTDGYYTCNTTKGTPCLSADIFGDWREEVIVRAADSKSVRIYTTTYDTDYRITTLMHDAQYRTQVAGQNVAYNQPPHPSFYLGSEEALPERPDVNVGDSVATKRGATIDTSHKYTITNVGSGLFLEVEGAVAANGTNVCQGTTGANVWTFEDAGDGYYRLYSELGDGKTYLLDLDYGQVENGTNIGIWGDTASDAQLFKFVDKGDGSYEICTKATADNSCLGVVSGSTEAGANVVQWECDGSANQSWKLSIYVDPIYGELVESLLVTDTSYNNNAWNYKNWKIDTSIAVGDLIYGDRDFTWVTLPEELIGSEAVLTACDHKYPTGNLAEMTVAEDATVYVALDQRVTAPGAWLSSWTKTDLTAVSSNDVTYAIYSYEATAGETIVLGTNGQSSGCVNYTAFAVRNETVEATEPPTEEPTAAPTEPPTEEPTQVPTEGEEVLYGDVDVNGTVNITDVIALSKALMGAGDSLTEQQSKNADVDVNGTINTSDALNIMKYLVKLIEVLPV